MPPRPVWARRFFSGPVNESVDARIKSGQTFGGRIGPDASFPSWPGPVPAIHVLALLNRLMNRIPEDVRA